MDNKVVAHFRDGRLMKGTTNNFSPMRDRFHLIGPDTKAVEVPLAQLKALFFVRNLAGDRTYRERKDFDPSRNLGRKIRCELFDGEVLTGYCQGYDAKRLGFFIVPADARSNNERVFIINAATKKVEFT
jgi:hypothetical protein